MVTQYADRAFLAMNGAKLADVQSANLNLDFSSKPVDSMTQHPFNTGFVKGNMKIDVDFEMAVQNALATAKPEFIDFANNDVSLNFVCGADQYIVTGLFPKTAKTGASGIGTEAKKSSAYGGLKVTDAVGNSILFPLSLSLAG